MERLLLVLPILAVVLASGCTQTQQVSGDIGNVPDQPQTYTLADISQHYQASDCWLAIHGKVYDVTSWIPVHPGGQAILEGCGKDATDLYETRPMGSGTPHSQSARSLLPNYYIGELA